MGIFLNHNKKEDELIRWKIDALWLATTIDCED